MFPNNSFRKYSRGGGGRSAGLGSSQIWYSDVGNAELGGRFKFSDVRGMLTGYEVVLS